MGTHFGSFGIQGGYMYMIYSPKVLQLDRDPPQAWCPGSCCSLWCTSRGCRSHTGRGCTYMHYDEKDSSSSSHKKDFNATKRLTRVLWQKDGPAWVVQSCCIRVTAGALGPTAHRTLAYDPITRYTIKKAGSKAWSWARKEDRGSSSTNIIMNEINLLGLAVLPGIICRRSLSLILSKYYYFYLI